MERIAPSLLRLPRRDRIGRIAYDRVVDPESKKELKQPRYDEHERVGAVEVGPQHSGDDDGREEPDDGGDVVPCGQDQASPDGPLRDVQPVQILTPSTVGPAIYSSLWLSRVYPRCSGLRDRPNASRGDYFASFFSGLVAVPGAISPTSGISVIGSGGGVVAMV